MRKIIISGILLMMLGIAIIDFIKKEERNTEMDSRFQISAESDEDEGNVGLEVGDEAPDFELQSMTGDFITLSDYRGKKVMLNFWATWCPPCKAEMPDMEKFYQNSEIEILAINLVETETKFQDIKQFQAEYQLTFPILLDNGNKASDLYRIRPIPASYLIDSNGIIQYFTYGPMSYEKMMEEYMQLD
ncbi:redoxin domain-containing protein [Gracilibacillus oryzae]|uniref:Redoxin domain-containing protein n=1 Tax=Gracilibacillus oryzae TaxID=1672701 RepID=A0A7C8GQF0_9BACI|nr:redoxin domain-containing protein [Gracilibacillus oryzae]KAB8125763.1 redoxin domain-containing protein [Gracilibacillus oryzae]